MIRELSIYDLHLATQAGREFFIEGKLPGEFIDSVFIASWTRLIHRNIGVVFGAFHGEQFVGGLGAMIYNDLNDDRLVSMELFWYVRAAHRKDGLKLLYCYEAWAKAKGAARISMTHLTLNADKMKRFYESMGYRALDFNYIKTL